MEGKRGRVRGELADIRPTFPLLSDEEECKQEEIKSKVLDS